MEKLRQADMEKNNYLLTCCFIRHQRQNNKIFSKQLDIYLEFRKLVKAGDLNFVVITI